MGVLDRLRGIDPERPRRSRPPRPLTAAGARVDLSAPQPVMLRRHDWQTAAWGYRDTVPEMRFAMDFVANQLGRMRVFPAENRPRGEDPLPFTRGGAEGGSRISQRTQQVALEAMEQLDLDSHGDGMFGRAGENFDIAGECYLLGELGPGNVPTWSIRSVSEVRLQGDRIQLVEPGKTSGGRILDPATSDLLRLWKPHPQFYEWPDTGMSASLEYAEELRIYSRLIRTAGRSRLSAGAALYVPDEFSLTRAGGNGQAPATPTLDGEGESDDPFMDELVSAMINPIADESDPSAVVPFLIRGPAMIDGKPAADLIKAVEIPRQDPEKLADQREKATKAFARGLSLPPEILLGIGDVNHWSGWVIDATTVKNYLEPRAEVLVDSWTAAYLRPYLEAAQCPPEEIARSIVWFDPSELVQSPNRGQDAKDAHGAGVISDEVLARSLGFGVEDMPTIQERLFRAIEARALSDQQIPVMLAAAGLPPEDPLVVAAVTAARAGKAQGPAQIQGPQVVEQAPDPGAASPTDPVPDVPVPRTASAQPERRELMRVDEHLCRRLGEVDTQLVTRLLAHCEATVGRAVERAATRIKARAQRDPELAGGFRGRDAVAVIAELVPLDRARLVAFAADDDFTDSIDSLQQLWTDAIGTAARAVAELVARMLRRDVDEQLVARLEAGGRSAWPWLAQRLTDLAQAVLYGDRRPPTSRGETSPGAVPVSLVRGAIAQAAGLPEGSPGVDDSGMVRSPTRAEPAPSLSTGQAVRDTMRSAGAAELGFEWNYYGIERNRFIPHYELSGVRFEGYTDPKVAARPEDLGWIGPFYSAGDHNGCLCSNLVIWAVPRDPNEARALADAAAVIESESARLDRELLAEIDDEQDLPWGTLPGGQTHAQRARDLRDELVSLRAKHIRDREVQ